MGGHGAEGKGGSVEGWLGPRLGGVLRLRLRRGLWGLGPREALASPPGSMTAFPSLIVQRGLYPGMSAQEVGPGGLSVLASGPSVGLGAGMHVCASSSGVQGGPPVKFALHSTPVPLLLPLSVCGHCPVCVSKDTCGSGSVGGKHEGEAKVIAAGSPRLRGDNNRPKCKRKTY